MHHISVFCFIGVLDICAKWEDEPVSSKLDILDMGSIGGSVEAHWEMKKLGGGAQVTTRASDFLGDDACFFSRHSTHL
jgi:hypothetical protein